MSNQQNWQYDEMRQVGVDFDQPEMVAIYERKQGTNSDANRALLRRLGVSEGMVIVDIGAGTGALAFEASRLGAEVHFVDVSSTMLDYARQKAQESQLNNVHFHHAGFLTYDYSPEVADIVISKFALHHLPDFWKQVALTRIAKMLKPGGLLYLHDIVFSFDPKDYDNQIESWIKRVARSHDEGFTKEEFEMHVREEYSTYGWILEGMLQRAGFEIIEANYPFHEYANYICRKPKRNSS